MDIVALSRKLLDQYGYSNWTIEFDSTNVFAGKTVYSASTLVFAECLRTMPEHVMKDVVVHEIAHVRAGQFVESHGDYWRLMAVSMGGTGNRRIIIEIIIFMLRGRRWFNRKITQLLGDKNLSLG